MNVSQHWNQLNELEAFQHRLEACYPSSWIPRPEIQDESMPVTEWSPLVDISEDDKEYRLKIELPEVKREDISVTAEAGAEVLQLNRILWQSRQRQDACRHEGERD